MPRKKSSRQPSRDPSDGDVSAPFISDKRVFIDEDNCGESQSRRDRIGRSKMSSKDRRKKKSREPEDFEDEMSADYFDDFIGQKSANGDSSVDDEESGFIERRSSRVDKALLTSEDDRRTDRRKGPPDLFKSQGGYEDRQSHRSKPAKRSKNKWYRSSHEPSNRGFESEYNITGVKYRSASSTARALEELKRKRLEAREKKRAIGIMVMMVLIAGVVHFMGRETVAPGVVSKGNMGDSAAVDKVYGKSKGDTKMGSVQGANAAMLNAEINSYGSLATDGDSIPPPIEKTYDDAHQFLVPLHHFADVRDTPRPTDTAFFFHVPRAGGSTIKDMMGKCMGLIQASEVGVRDGHNTDTALQVLTIQENKYVNVDTTTIPGIQRAVDMGLARSGMSDLIVSSYFHESASLFDLEHQGRAFIMLRNPFDRAVSMYYHRLHELHDLDESVSIEDYGQGNGIENNWMTRFLTNRMTGELTKEDMEQAKEILKEKFLIGFLDDLEESVYRIIKYNGWKYADDETAKMKQEDCIADLAKLGSNINTEGYELPKRGTQAYALIIWQTQFDSKLFEYARELFDDQTKTYGSKERKKQRKKEKQKKKGG